MRVFYLGENTIREGLSEVTWELKPRGSLGRTFQAEGTAGRVRDHAVERNVPALLSLTS